MAIGTDPLRRVPLFTGMTESAIASVRQITHEMEFETGQELVRQGDPGDCFIVIVDGHARVIQDGAVLGDLGPGDYLGEIALIDGGPRTATVTATDRVHALVVTRDDFSRLIDDHPSVRLDILTALTQRIRRNAANPLD